METLRKIYTQEKVQQLRAECDRLASRYVLGLCALLPAHLNMATAHNYVASKILALCETITDVQQAIQDDIPCKEEQEPDVRLQELTGVICSPYVISEEDKAMLNDLIKRNGLEMLQLFPQRQAQEQALRGMPAEEPVEVATGITESEREYIKRMALKYGIAVSKDEQGVFYVDHPLLAGNTYQATSETDLYNYVVVLASDIRNKQAKEITL